MLKVLAQLSPSANTLTPFYTAPVGATVVSSLVIANRSAVAATFRISVAPSGALDNPSQYIAYDLAIQANDVISYSIGMTLGAGDVVRVYSSSTLLSFSLFGDETIFFLGVGAFRINTGTLAALTSTTPLSYLIVNAWDYNDSKVVAARNAGVKTLVYKDIMGSRADNVGGLYSVGVPLSQANPNESWFIHKSGVRQQFSSFPGVYVMNVGNAGYQAAWLSNVLGECQTNGWQGVWADDCNIDPVFEVAQPYDEYATQASWQAAQRSFLAAVGPSFLSSNKLFIPNFQHRGITSDGTIFSDWIQFTSGFNVENYTKWGTSSTGQHLTPEWNNIDQDLLTRANSAGKIFLGITYAPKADSRSQLYARASFLIDWNGIQPSAIIFEPTDPEAQDPIVSSFTLNVGLPLGAKSVGSGGAGTWKRNFQYAVVNVDTNAGTGTIT